MTWDKFCEVFRITFSKEIKEHEICFELHCGKFGMKDVFCLSSIYYEKLYLEDHNCDSKFLSHMYRSGNIKLYLGVEVEIDINKEIKPIIK